MGGLVRWWRSSGGRPAESVGIREVWNKKVRGG